jgi:phosphatidylserine/phosphatidylglycerophosphate/cardiolipin synthase-like enzyme
MRQLKETLSDLLISLIISPDDLWLVSPWVSDFDLLDNRCGDWNTIDPRWGARYVRFSELLAAAIDAGCNLKSVTNSHKMNQRFFDQIISNLHSDRSPAWFVKDSLHTKGLLCSRFFLAGSMNFTYNGTHNNDERIQLMIDEDAITEAKIEFERQYSE